MMENNQMIYTAIYQNSQGELSYSTYMGQMSRHSAWLEAAKTGAAQDKCLVALVPGVHPVYFYSDFVDDFSDLSDTSSIKNHDLYEMK